MAFTVKETAVRVFTGQTRTAKFCLFSRPASGLSGRGGELYFDSSATKAAYALWSMRPSASEGSLISMRTIHPSP